MEEGLVEVETGMQAAIAQVQDFRFRVEGALQDKMYLFQGS